MMQTSLDSFGPRPTPLFFWGRRAWCYRSNAEAYVRDLHMLPSGDGIWPRLLACDSRFPRYDGWDLCFYQCRGDCRADKLIRRDGTVGEFLYPVDPADDTHDAFIREVPRVESAWVDGELLHYLLDNGTEWTQDIVEDSECPIHDTFPLDPSTYPEHFMIVALQKGIRDDDLMAMSDLAYRFQDEALTVEPMRAVWRTIPIVGIAPNLRTYGPYEVML